MTTDERLTAAAHALLLEMREPSKEMLVAGNAVFHAGRIVTAKMVWQAMIDEMLK